MANKTGQVVVDNDLKEVLWETINGKYYKKYQRSWKTSGKSLKSLITYESYFFIFLKFIHEKYNDIDLYSEDFLKSAVDYMEEYIEYMQEEYGNNKKVINTKISAVSSFFLWSVRRKIINNHPFSGKLERIKGSKDEKIRKSQFLTREQIFTIKKELMTNDKYDIQDQILFSVVIDSGNRVGAVEQFKISNMNLDNMLFYDIVEKGNKLVEATFDIGTKELIEEWLYERKDGYDKMEVDSLFIAKHKGEYTPMRYGTLQTRFSRIGTEILGLERFGMHDGRKTCGNLVYEETGDLTLAQGMLNHKDPSTTLQHYIKPKSKTSLRNDIKKRIQEKKDMENNELV